MSSKWKQPPSVIRNRRLGDLYDRAPKWLIFETLLELSRDDLDALTQAIKTKASQHNWKGQL